MEWSGHALERLAESLRSARPAVTGLIGRGEHAGEVAGKVLRASRDAALQTAERVVRGEGADQAADALHSLRSAGGVLDAAELPIPDYDELNVSDARWPR